MHNLMIHAELDLRGQEEGNPIQIPSVYLKPEAKVSRKDQKRPILGVSQDCLWWPVFSSSS